MKKSSLLFAGILYACVLFAQPSFQTSLQAGISLPLNSNDINATHAGKAIHFGNHLDYTFGNSAVRFGLGAYIGYINAISTDNKYKEIGEAIAEKYRFATSQLTFNSAAFKSTHILLGPVASFGSDKFNINIWAKGGYGLNEPGRYSVVYKENGVVNNVYISQAGENKNGLAYSAGAGIKLAISQYVGLQLAAGYFSTQTDQVNYNFDREKGTIPKYYTAANQFIQASAGLQFTIGNPGKRNAAYNGSRYTDADTGNPSASRMDQKIKTKSNIKNDRAVNTDEENPVASKMDQKIKTKSNIKNDRLANNNNADSDSLLFTPEKIELRSMISDGTNRTQLQSIDNYLTGFAYQAQNGAVISQCGSNAMAGEPIPGIDVRLKRTGGAATDMLSARTNKDGSFAFSNITPGDYTAEAGNSRMDVTVNGNNENAFKTLDIMGGSCGNTKENYIINAGDKTYVEVTSAREAGSGMATGKKHIGNVKYEDIKVSMGREAGSGLATGRRMHKPYRVADTDFEINPDKIVSNDG
ncbi:MAG TPA: carboxypeptidase-like regulatory domain-containing protein, partial [Chitinophagaceae bacterium]|nr:carboxypeptidase-like regulatory domain-containing protein [Chitinophagaceae bacterium]